MITVKVTTEHPKWPVQRQSPGLSSVWGNCRFLFNQEVEKCDYWVVCDGLQVPESSVCSPQNTLLITWEPPSIKEYNQTFLDQFSHVITCQPKLQHLKRSLSQQAHPWFVEKSFDELVSMPRPKKTKKLSIICSDKKFTPGHEKRLVFANKLRKRLGSSVELFGRGIKDFENKWDVLAPFKYSIAMENGIWDHWITEKLPDCFLAYTFPFYWGALNADQYFSPDSFERIDINNLEGSIKIIEEILSDETHYEKKLGILEVSRLKYLNEIQIFPFLESWVNRTYLLQAPQSLVTFEPQKDRLKIRFKKRAGLILNSTSKVLGFRKT